MSRNILFILGLSLVACGRDAKQANYKLAGVGLNPDEISPSPTLYGGLASYDFVEFGGGALPLGLLGLSSYIASGPALGDFEAPYSLVSATSFVFDTDTPAPDVFFGSFAAPPSKVGSCQTVYEPSSYLSGIADVGNYIDISTEDGSGFKVGRRPATYPTNASKVFPYYLDLGVYRAGSRAWLLQDEGEDDWSLSPSDSNKPNFPFEENVQLSFPGALPPASATFSSIPQPFQSGYIHPMPSRPMGVMLSWDGPRYSGDGLELSDSGSVTTCMQYNPHSNAPTSPSDCLNYEPLEEPAAGYNRGQMYTGPWDTNGGVTINWLPGPEGSKDTVSITVRLMGEVDETTSSLVDPKVKVDKTAEFEAEWARAINAGLIPDSECPEYGYRNAQACDNNVEFVFDDSLRQGDGYVPSLQGDPLSKLAEVTCTVADTDGEFVITDAMLEDAYAYGRQHGAKGAIFYISRSTSSDLPIPDARDQYGNRKAISDLLLVTRAVQLGRFWVNDGTLSQ